MAAILADAAAVGNATARAIVFDTRDEAAFLYPDSAWKTAFIGGDYQWLIDGGQRRPQPRRPIPCSSTSPPSTRRPWRGGWWGLGSQYAYAERDRDGEYLDGSATYRLALPAGVPAKDFWSVVAYDPQTRSELQTSQPFPSKNSQRDALEVNPDGSVDLWFGPAPSRAARRTGSRPFPARAGSPSCGSTARWSPGSRRRGDPGSSSDIHGSPSRESSTGPAALDGAHRQLDTGLEGE